MRTLTSIVVSAPCVMPGMRKLIGPPVSVPWRRSIARLWPSILSLTWNWMLSMAPVNWMPFELSTCRWKSPLAISWPPDFTDAEPRMWASTPIAPLS